MHHRQPAPLRELKWSVFSPPVLDRLAGASTDPWDIELDEDARELLKSVERKPEPLMAYLRDGRDRRLGTRFESLWSYFLIAHPRYQLFARNFTVRSEGQTLGALDLLFRDRQRKTVIHGEIAVKFYLLYPRDADGDPDNWIGPNPEDNLGRKLERMRSHQLPLSTQQAVQMALRDAGLPVPEERRACIKGVLFYPLGREVNVSDELNPHHLKGYWLYADQVEELLDDMPDRRWQLLDKSQWLHISRSGQWLAPVDLRHQLSLLMRTNSRPIMIAASSDAAGSGVERRYFIVPESWPGGGSGGIPSG